MKAEYLEREVSQRATLNYQQQKFCTKDSYEEQQIQTSRRDELAI